MNWLDVHRPQLELAGVLLFLAAFWSTFIGIACKVLS